MHIENDYSRLALPPPRSRARLFLRTAVKRAMDGYLQLPVAVASGLCRVGLSQAAEKFLGALFDASPYDLALGERLGDVILGNGADRFPLGSVERGIYLLYAMEKSVASPRLTEAYLDNLGRFVATLPRRQQPGRALLGIGTGRTGSTTLAGIVDSIDGALSTHENPPLVWWDPLPQQRQFHLARMKVLSGYYSVVFDCAYWWINMLEGFWQEFPDGKVIGLHRDTEATVGSFMKIMPKYGNRWVQPYNGIWVSEMWDPTFPHYPVPQQARRDPDGAKRALIRRYVTEYNQRLHDLAAREGERVLLLRTEELDQPATRQRIGAFLDLPVGLGSVRLNVRNAHDSTSGSWWF